MKRVAVTGGAGFIGSNLVKLLLARGLEVYVIDDLSTGKLENIPKGVTFHRGNILSSVSMNLLRHTAGPIDAWFHLAAQTDVRKSVSDPFHDAEVNVLGTLQVLKVAAIDDAPVIFTSTGGAMYGPDEHVPTPDFTPGCPVSPYGASKLAAETYIAQDSRLNQTRHCVLRLANVYGPGQDPHGEAGVVAIFAGKLSSSEPATLYGNGEQTRDYVYVGDVTRALVKAAVDVRSGVDSCYRYRGSTPTYNIGTGVETSTRTLWETMCRINGTDPGFNLEPARDGELERSALDASRGQSALGLGDWTTLEDGLGYVLLSGNLF